MVRMKYSHPQSPSPQPVNGTTMGSLLARSTSHLTFSSSLQTAKSLPPPPKLSTCQFCLTKPSLNLSEAISCLHQKNGLVTASWMGQTIAPPSFQIAKPMSPHPGHSSLPSHLFQDNDQDLQCVSTHSSLLAFPALIQVPSRLISLLKNFLGLLVTPHHFEVPTSAAAKLSELALTSPAQNNTCIFFFLVFTIYNHYLVPSHFPH